MKRVSILLAVLGWTGLVACRAGDQASVTGRPSDPERLVLEDELSLGRPLGTANLTVWPVYSRHPVDVGDFETLEEAQAHDGIVVRELGVAADPRATGAAVGCLEIRNPGKRTVLIPAGTVVKGGKQDRQVGEDTLVPPGQLVQARSFCVEPRRWSVARQGRSTGGLFRSTGSVAAAAVRYQGQYRNNQAEVWRNVARYHLVAGKSPATGTYLALVDEQDPAARKRRERLEKAVADHFRSLPEPAVGFAYAVNGKPVSVRTFAHSRLFEGQFKAFCRAMSLEADLARDPEHAASALAASAKDVVALVRAINQEKETAREARAGNRIGLRRNSAGASATCYVQKDGTWVAVTRDWTASPGDVAKSRSSLPRERR